MDNCKHINKISPGRDHSILNPQKWMCFQCGTTESVWACLSCPNVSCGRYNEEHALKHFHDTKHPLAIEVNDRYVFCYECDDYILNDNASGDLKILRSALSAISTQSFSDLEAKSRRILRSHSLPAGGIRWEEKLLRYQDLSQTAIKFRRHYQLAKAFTNWKLFVLWEKDKRKPQNDSASSSAQQPGSHEVMVLPSKRAIIPGVAGLRNLGNTCYMNSILQVLSHLKPFRDYFLHLKPMYNSSTGLSAAAVARNLQRQTTVDCFKYLAEGENSPVPTSPGTSRSKGGLNGGGHSKSSSPMVRGKKCNTNGPVRTLCEELHYLLRVLWSGKWALVSPHKMLSAVWQLIPFFKGFAQQDAQEFLSELLDKVDSELRRMFNLNFIQDTIIDDLFQGKLVSEVRCSKCGTTSQTYEPFCDLSLEFPAKYHTQSTNTQEKCHLQEMLSKFTEAEDLGEIYACEKCQEEKKTADGATTVHTSATKQLLIHALPRILRLHLKRFMWSGRNHRGKISTHVEFPEKLDLEPFCHRDVDTKFSLYQLSAVVIHHGRGFGSGHYTAYCHNQEAGSWVHCNDSRVEMSSLKDVTSSQVYILFYTKVRQKVQHTEDPEVSLQSFTSIDDFDEMEDTFEEEADEEVTFNFKNSKIPKFL